MSRGLLGDERHRVVLVSGPPGAGKSALIDEWASRHPNVARLDLTRRHDSPHALAAAVLAALGVPPSTGSPGDQGDWLDQVMSAVEARPSDGRPLTLVFDGADAITDPETVQLLSDLVDLGPPGLRLVVATRHRCPRWLSRSRATGTTACVRAADLRMSPDEVTALLGDPAPELAGWALGVRLLAALGPDAGREAIHDYLRSEVMHATTTELRHLLHAVSVAGSVTPAQAINLSGHPGAGRLLDEFASTIQLVTVTDGPTFTLHPVLARHLAEEFAIEQWDDYARVSRLHAAWLAQQGRLEDGVGVHVALGDLDGAAHLLRAHWQRIVLRGRVDEVLGVLDLLPESRIVADPQLCMISAMAGLAAGDEPRWRRWSDLARAQAGPGTEVEPGVALDVALRASGRLARALRDAPLDPGPVGPGLGGVWKAISDVAVGLELVRTRHHLAAIAHFEQAEVTCRVSGDQLALVHALAGRALAIALDGGSDAISPADEAIAIADRLCPESRWVVANAHLALAVAHTAAGRTHAGRGCARRTLSSLADLPDHVEQRTRREAQRLLPGPPPSALAVRTTRPDLSDRERRVLRALCGPLTLREIAGELYVSHNTVKSQVSSIFRKLGVHDRAAAIAAARSQHLVGS